MTRALVECRRSRPGIVSKFGRPFQRALIVEDNAPIRKTLLGVSQEHAREVVPVATLREARAMLTRPFDLVIADVRLPDGTALDLVAALASQRPQVSIVVVTGTASTEEAFWLAQVGVDALLAKPFGLTALREVLSRLASARAQNEAAALQNAARNSFETQLDALAQARSLTAQQTALLRALLRGVPRKQLAQSLGISENTCKTAVRRLLARCNASRVADVINEVLAREAGSSLP